MVRRFLLEFVVPAISLKVVHRRKRVSQSSRKKFDESSAKAKDEYAPLSYELEKGEYELYDDYLEICIELGYLCFFASAYTSAAAFASFSYLVEARKDCSQLSLLYRKHRPVSVLGVLLTLANDACPWAAAPFV